jgi:hypothetical protein
MALNTKPEGRRRVGRPKLRWLDDLEADVKTLRIKSEASGEEEERKTPSYSVNNRIRQRIVLCIIFCIRIRMSEN